MISMAADVRGSRQAIKATADGDAPVYSAARTVRCGT
jgi:hypothetical protein